MAAPRADEEGRLWPKISCELEAEAGTKSLVFDFQYWALVCLRKCHEHARRGACGMEGRGLLVKVDWGLKEGS